MLRAQHFQQYYSLGQVNISSKRILRWEGDICFCVKHDILLKLYQYQLIAGLFVINYCLYLQTSPSSVNPSCVLPDQRVETISGNMKVCSVAINLPSNYTWTSLSVKGQCHDLVLEDKIYDLFVSRTRNLILGTSKDYDMMMCCLLKLFHYNLDIQSQCILLRQIAA